MLTLNFNCRRDDSVREVREQKQFRRSVQWGPNVNSENIGQGKTPWTAVIACNLIWFSSSFSMINWIAVQTGVAGLASTAAMLVDGLVYLLLAPNRMNR